MKHRITLVAAVGLALMVGSTAAAGDLEFNDPKGDDDGHGKIIYPTHKDYKKGSFDLRTVKIEDDGSNVEITIEFSTKIEDPWDSKAWGGNGFSLQFVQVYVDKDHKAGSGRSGGLPGMNVQFLDSARWEKVLLISPQPNNRLKSEISQKASQFAADIVLPSKVRAKGKTIQATFKKSDLGGAPSATWGFQVLVQSNEGYPTKEDLLTRKVNEYEGEHRFGGGNDFDCDPHVIDMLAGAGKGAAAEAEAQHTQLGTHSCGANGKGSLAKIDMVYGE